MGEHLAGKAKQLTDDRRFDVHLPGEISEMLSTFTHFSKDYLYSKALICGFRAVGSVITDCIVYDIM